MDVLDSGGDLVLCYVWLLNRLMSILHVMNFRLVVWHMHITHWVVEVSGLLYHHIARGWRVELRRHIMAIAWLHVVRILARLIDDVLLRRNLGSNGGNDE